MAAGEQGHRATAAWSGMFPPSLVRQVHRRHGRATAVLHVANLQGVILACLVLSCETAAAADLASCTANPGQAVCAGGGGYTDAAIASDLEALCASQPSLSGCRCFIPPRRPVPPREPNT